MSPVSHQDLFAPLNVLLSTIISLAMIREWSEFSRKQLRLFSLANWRNERKIGLLFSQHFIFILPGNTFTIKISCTGLSPPIPSATIQIILSIWHTVSCGEAVHSRRLHNQCRGLTILRATASHSVKLTRNMYPSSGTVTCDKWKEKRRTLKNLEVAEKKDRLFCVEDAGWLMREAAERQKRLMEKSKPKKGEKEKGLIYNSQKPQFSKLQDKGF